MFTAQIGSLTMQSGNQHTHKYTQNHISIFTENITLTFIHVLETCLNPKHNDYKESLAMFTLYAEVTQILRYVTERFLRNLTQLLL